MDRFVRFKKMAKEEFNVEIKKNNNPSSFAELFLEHSDCSKCIHKDVCDHWIASMYGTDVICPEEHCCEHYKEEVVAKWKTREDKNDYLWVECSNCGFRVENYNAVTTGRSSTHVVGYKWKACPKCGAHMIFKGRK